MHCVAFSGHAAYSGSACSRAAWQVVLVHVVEAVTHRSPEGKLTVDLAKYRPVSRLGGDAYGRTAEFYDLPRPDTFWQEQGHTAAAATLGHGG